jgi:DNA-binding NarL/FixJ family response regulator
MATTVLIVDDDPGFRRVAAELLVDRGYRVVGEAGGVEEGFALVRASTPDAVLLDVQLEDGDGISFATRLRGERDAPRILLTSTDGDAAPPGVVEECGAAGFVAKDTLAGADLDRYLNG